MFILPRKKIRKKSDSHYLLFLSLMLLLLAFFILLNALSVFEDNKSKAVFHSIGKSFLIPQKMLMGKSLLTSLEGEVMGHDPVLKEIGDLFKTELAMLKMHRLILKDKIEISFDKKDVWQEAKGLNPRFYPLLDRIDKVLKGKKAYLLFIMIDRKAGDYANEFDNRDFALLSLLRSAFGKRFLDLLDPKFGFSFEGTDRVLFSFVKREK